VQPRHITASLATLAVMAGSITACGGSDSAERSARAGDSAPQATPSRSSQSKRTGGPGSVGIANFKFAPASLTVSPGARVTVANHDSTAHTATADQGQSFDTGDIDPGSSATITLSKPGTYAYHCSIHPFMHGTLVVR
jgi:plastocyanin